MNGNITIVILTKNEERNIKELLNNIVDLEFPILIIDSGSTDNTLQIAKEYNVDIIINQFFSFPQQRNFALQKAKTDWVFFLDADERLTPELKNFLKNFNPKENINAYTFYIKSVAFGRTLNYAWSSRKIRLMNKNFCMYDENILVHEKIKVKGTVGEISKGFIENHTYKNFDQYIQKMILYTKLEGKTFSSENISLFRVLFEPIALMLDRIFIKKWILDGWAGIHAAFTAFIVRFLSLSIARDISNNGNIYNRRRKL